jgi:hypothetical protein
MLAQIFFDVSPCWAIPHDFAVTLKLDCFFTSSAQGYPGRQIAAPCQFKDTLFAFFPA